MSKENVKAFLAKLEKNQDLYAECIKLLREDGVESATAQSKIVAFGQSAGFQFTEDDMKEYCAELADGLHENGELNDEEMQQAAGGSCQRTSIFISIVGFGIACAIVSIISQIGREPCAQRLSAIDNDKCHD